MSAAAPLILDANVWMNSAFEPNSIAYRLASHRKKMGGQLILARAIEKEIKRILAEKQKKLSLKYDPAKVFQQRLKALPIVRKRSPDPSEFIHGINESDQHVARAGRQLKAEVITNDVDLVVQCSKAGIACAFPWTVLERDLGPQVARILTFTQLGARSGSVFARVLPTWPPTKGQGDHSVFQIPGFGHLYFAGDSLSWCFKSSMAGTIYVDLQPIFNQATCVLVSYNLPGPVILRVANQNPIERRSSSAQSLALGVNAANILNLHNGDGGEQFNGYIKHLVASENTVGADRWKVLTDLPDAAPNPFDDHVLDQALIKVQGGQ
jgi:hypothetical protein